MTDKNSLYEALKELDVKYKKDLCEALYEKDEDKLMIFYKKYPEIVIDNMYYVIYYRHNKVLKEIVDNHQFKQQDINQFLIWSHTSNNYTSFTKVLDKWQEDTKKRSFLEFFLVVNHFTMDTQIYNKVKQLDVSPIRVSKYEKMIEKRIKDKKNNKWYLEDLYSWQKLFNEIKIINLAKKLDNNLVTKPIGKMYKI